jgi:CheY-like chemotaxis protein
MEKLPDPPVMRMQKKVLIVEDQAIAAMALQATVESMGYRVSGVVDSGEAAIAHAGAERPDLILMDTRLRTAMTGVEAANAVWEQFGVRSVFVSASNATELQGDYRGAEPFLLLVKPVLDADLQRIIAELFDDA